MTEEYARALAAYLHMCGVDARPYAETNGWWYVAIAPAGQQVGWHIRDAYTHADRQDEYYTWADGEDRKELGIPY